ncbi:insulin receptor substrate 1-B isoform X1 [Conger conger]|uniref:insulin receptor substrate 1-B isoform X1 n=1 Tax=Conger conger TaxID=82655 RepID=UPI002A5AD54B|nr:insulin receptor substrate 1-B isoform X1 [Conger conger]
MASPASDHGCFSDVRKVGYLRKPKSMHRRFFVLRTASVSGPSRLEYYENEKKWRHKSGAPKRSIPLESCFNINKRADSKNKYLVALYTKEEYFAIAADSEQEQDLWYQALLDLHNKGKLHEPAGGSAMGEDSYGEATPGPAFKEVWQVILKPKGLGQIKNLIGIYRLCLTNKTISFVKLNSDAAAVVLQLMNIRRCGHSENFFFIEVGRSAVTGPGEFWMQVDDSVVAQNMHETILDAMKSMSEEFRPRSKSQSSSNCSTPISVPLRRHHHNNPPPSQVGLGRRSRAESVTATSPAAQGKQTHSFRVRACSDGEGTMSRPASVEGSPGSPCSARTHAQRHRGGSRLHPPLSHSRSIPMPSSRCSPSATSPVSLSSSSTSGHGSTSDCLYPRRSSASASGSPSDGGFISSDEYGSSPCDFRSSFRSTTPDSLEHTPPAREEELNNYMSMSKPSLVPNGHCARPQPRCTPPRLEDSELEKSFRKRTHSSGASPPTVCHQKTPSQSSTASLEEYAPMMSTYSRASLYRQSPFLPAQSYPEESLDLHLEGSRTGRVDDGYMPMSPGVAPVACKSSDYMPMSPKSVSAPQQILSPRQHCRVDSNGYMMMSPSVSCSPESTNFGKVWTNGTNPALCESSEGKGLCGDYINMSPASCSTTSTPPDCYFNQVEETHKPMHSYYSLPRSFRHTHRKQEQSPLRFSVNSGRLVYGDSSSSSASSDSLGGQGNGKLAVKPQDEVDGRLARPTRLSLDGSRASTLPRARESPFPPVPTSPGEYVDMEFSDRPFSASLASLLAPAFVETDSERRSPHSSEYMNMELGARGRKPRPEAKGSACPEDGAEVSSAIPPAGACAGMQTGEYVHMQLGALCHSYPEAQMVVGYSEVSSSADTPSQEGALVNEVPDSSCLGLMGSMSGLSAFSRVNSSPNRNQVAKVIRADPHGRRRHSSETFSSTTAVSGAAAAPPSGEDVKRHSSASFENVWLSPCERREATPATSLQNGLNYMDLDLAKEQIPSRGGPSDPNPYASIRFQKEEHPRKAPGHREE